MLLCTISKFDNILYMNKQHDACEERDHPVIEPSINLFHFYYYFFFFLTKYSNVFFDTVVLCYH